MPKKSILVVGAGFVGVIAAKQLAKKLNDEAEITLVDYKEHFTFNPRLIDALQGDLQKADLVKDLEVIAKESGFVFLQGKATSIDRANRRVSLETRSGQVDKTYDYLIVGTGAQTQFYGIPGAEKYGKTLKSWNDVENIEKCVDEALEKAAQEKRQASFVVVGGGATGIEAAFALEMLVRAKMKRKSLSMPVPSYHVVQGAPQILPGFHAPVVTRTEKELHRRGIEAHVGMPVSSVQEHSITSKDTEIPYDLLIWAAGLKAVPLPMLPEPVKDQAGWLTVDRFLRVDERIYAAGDAVSYAYHQLTVPKNAQTARLMALSIVNNIVADLHNGPLYPFTYFTKGTMLLMGQNGLIDFRFFHVTGRWTTVIRRFFYDGMFRSITK